MPWKAHEADSGGTFASVPPGRAHLCRPEGAELSQTLRGRRANSTPPTSPASGVCLVTQLTGLRTMCWPGSSSTETELQRPGGSHACGIWFDLSVHKNYRDAKMI